MWSGTVQRQSAAAEYKRRFELQFSGTEQRQSDATQCKCTVQRHSDTVQHFRGPVQQHRAEVAKKIERFLSFRKKINLFGELFLALFLAVFLLIWKTELFLALFRFMFFFALFLELFLALFSELLKVYCFFVHF